MSLPVAAAAEPELAQGTLLADRYRVGAQLGRGAMGLVYAGEHVRVGRPVAIKVLTAAWSRKAAVRRRFEAEVRAASAAGHPNIIQVFDIGELPDGRLYSVMEHVDGIDLYRVLSAEAPLEIGRVRRLLREIAYGLRAAHDVGIVHRDLKPENVMVRVLPEGEFIKILDFGIAAGVAAPGGGSRVTMPGLAIGTPEYMAPEQVDGDEPTPRFDIYAFGVLAFELLTSRLPLEDELPMRLMARKCNERAPAVTDLRPEVPRALADLIARCLSIDPAERPANLGEVLAVLEAGDTGGAVPLSPLSTRPTRPMSTSTPAPRASRLAMQAAEGGAREPRPASRFGVGLGVLVLLVGLGVGASAWLTGDDSVEEPLTARPADSRALPGEPESTPEPTATPEPAEEAKPVPKAEPVAQEPPPPLAGAKRGGAKKAVAGGAKPNAAPPSDDAGESARCSKVRRQAADARDAHDWDRVLKSAQVVECWTSAPERTRALTQAYMELGRFDDCARVGKRSRDPEVERWVELCEKRREP